MGSLARFSISLENDLLAKFDKYTELKKFHNRSDAVRALIRSELVKDEWRSGAQVAGAIVLVYDHHQRELMNRLTDIQHDFHGTVISNQHVHLDHHNCLEVIIVRGCPTVIQDLANRLKSTRGVKHCSLSMATTGEHLD